MQRINPDGTQTVFVYDAWGQLAAESSMAGSTVQGTQYVVGDNLGSTRLAMMGSTATERHDYQPFGYEFFPTTGNWRLGSGITGYNVNTIRQKFTGQERDSETGLDYFGARYFSGAQGRFTSPDPMVHPAQSHAGLKGFLSEPQRWNKYAYVSNNPLKYTDPNGGEQVAGCVGGGCYNNTTGQVISRQSTGDQLRTALIPVAGMAAAAGGSGLGWLGRAILGYLVTPRGQERAASALEGLSGAPPGSLAGNLGRLSAAEISTGERFAAQEGLQLQVSTHVGEEFVDAAGKTYDAMGQPSAYKFWNPAQFFSSITDHLNKVNDYTIIDLQGASADQIRQVKDYVGTLDQALQDKIKYVQ